MNKSASQTPFKPLDRESDEFNELFDALVATLQRHFGHCANFNAKRNAYRFLATYETVMEDFWTKKQALVSLKDLKRAVRDVIEAHERIPSLVYKELSGEASYHDNIKDKEFYENLTSGFVLKSLVPKREATTALEALKTLRDYRDVLIKIIDMTRSGLPKGIETRNRPLQKWALIHAAADLARAYNALDVSDSSGVPAQFESLLFGVFETFGFPRQQSVRQVYSGWRNAMDGKYEDSDLLDI